MNTSTPLLILLTAAALSTDGSAQAVAPLEAAPPAAANTPGIAPAGSTFRPGRAQSGVGLPGAMSGAGGGGYAVSWSTARSREISK
ncbi:MAG TPA: hypothetical protein VJW76_08340, partial [Verrucomicrobiae bacterium]|nr:hypothetical protein [Verrucomicrobiae bacterium]